MLSLEHQPTDRHQSSIRDNRFCLSPRTVPSEMVALSSQAFPKEWPSKRNGIRVATAESSVSGDKNNFFLVATSCSSLSFRLRTYSVPKRYHSLMYVGGVWYGVYIPNPSLAKSAMCSRKVLKAFKSLRKSSDSISAAKRVTYARKICYASGWHGKVSKQLVLREPYCDLIWKAKWSKFT